MLASMRFETQTPFLQIARDQLNRSGAINEQRINLIERKYVATKQLNGVLEDRLTKLAHKSRTQSGHKEGNFGPHKEANFGSKSPEKIRKDGGSLHQSLDGNASPALSSLSRESSALRYSQGNLSSPPSARHG